MTSLPEDGDKNINDIQLLHVDIVDEKKIRSERADGTNRGLLLRGTVTTLKHNKILV